MRDVLAITKALSDESRLRVLMLLRQGELCVCQIIHLLELAPSTVSKHLDILYQAGLIESRKAGRWVYYRLGERPSRAAKDAIGWLVPALADDEKVAQDAKRLQAVLKMDKEKLCCRYKGQLGGRK
jgi:DNA-binding transcriptional ArsR family regulator